MRSQRAQLRIRFNQLIEIATQFFQARLFHLSLQLVDVRLFFHLTLLLGVIIAAARDRAFAVRDTRPAGHRRCQRRAEIFGNLDQFFWAGDGDQPHHQKERHHCGHKIGVRDFPRAVGAMPTALVLAFFYDDDRMGLVFHASSVVVCWFGFFTARTCSSSSINDGRSLE